MRSVRSSGNISTEITLIKRFRKNSVKGWRRNYKLLGHPDFVFPKVRLVVFADGCFWHGHNCRNVKPSSNRAFWREKIERNKKRDKKNSAVLRERNWKVVRIWECEIDSEPSRKISKIKSFLKSCRSTSCS